MKSFEQIRREMENETHPLCGSITARYKFGSGGSRPVIPAAPSPIPRKIEVDVAEAEKEERDLAAKRRGRSRSILTRGLNFGDIQTSQSELLGA